MKAGTAIEIRNVVTFGEVGRATDQEGTAWGFLQWW